MKSRKLKPFIEQRYLDRQHTADWTDSSAQTCSWQTLIILDMSSHSVICDALCCNRSAQNISYVCTDVHQLSVTERQDRALSVSNCQPGTHNYQPVTIRQEHALSTSRRQTGIDINSHYQKSTRIISQSLSERHTHYQPVTIRQAQTLSACHCQTGTRIISLSLSERHKHYQPATARQAHALSDRHCQTGTRIISKSLSERHTHY